MKKKVFRTPLNYDHTKEIYSQNDLPSETVPDQSLTIPEMIKRFASGRSVNVKVYDDYGGDAEHLTGVDIRSLDMVEVQEMLQRTSSNLSKLKLETDRRRQERKDADLEASIIAKYEARRKEREDANKPDDKPVFIQPELPLPKPKNGA